MIESPIVTTSPDRAAPTVVFAAAATPSPSARRLGGAGGGGDELSDEPGEVHAVIARAAARNAVATGTARIDTDATLEDASVRFL